MFADVAIVGAGPVGLFLANQLQRRGLRYRLLEKRDTRQLEGTAVMLWPRTLEIFDQMGILPEVLECSLTLKARNVTQDGRLLVGTELNAAGHGYTHVSIRDIDLEEILERELGRRGGIIQWSSTVTGLERNFSGVEVEWTTTGTTHRVQCRYLVGCDGPDSFVRRRLGVSFSGDGCQESLLTGQVELNCGRSHSELWKLMGPGKLARLLPIPGRAGRYRIECILAAGSGEEELEPGLCQSLLPPNCEVRGIWPEGRHQLTQQLAERYRVGNCFLAGQAAHPQLPSDGLALDTGLQDAFNLGWKLAAVLRGEALDSLLESYHEERHAAGRQALDFCLARWREQREQSPGNPGYAGGIGYAQSRLAGGTLPEGQRGAAAGDRLDFIGDLTSPALGAPARLIEFLRHGDLQLIGFGGAWEELTLLAEHLKSVLGNQFHSLAIASPTDPPPPEGLLCLLDPQNRARQTWGEGCGAMLVRPDGHVGWRGRPARDEYLDGFLAQVSLDLLP